MIPLIFTGGTISMRDDPSQGGGAIPVLSGAEIVAATRGIERIAEIEAVDFGRYPGPHMTVERAWALRELVAAQLGRQAVTGVVVTHGTDSLEETAYLIARSVRSEKPIVFTGAMRTASDLGWDGPANLLNAVKIAACAEAGGYGVLVAMSSRIYSAIDVTKGHTHMLDAFESPGLGPVGVVDEDKVIFRRALPAPRPVIDCPSPVTPVDIVYAWQGADGRLLDASREAAAGLVIAAMGRGNVPPEMLPGIERWIASGRPVVITSRAGRGRVGVTYGYPGGGRRLSEMGAIFAGSRRPTQARIDLMLALGAGLSRNDLREIFEGRRAAEC